MRVLLTILILFMPTFAYAVDSNKIQVAIETASKIQTIQDLSSIMDAIGKMTEADPLGRHIELTNKKTERLAISVYKASRVTGVSWKLLLAISYVESNMCDENHKMGDKKPGTSGKSLYDYWSVGCLQTNLYWWGNVIDGAGISQEDLLEDDKSIIIGGLILKHKIERYGWQEGIKRYNGVGPKADEYKNTVLEVLKSIQS